MSRSKKSIKNLSFALIGQSVGILISFIARIIFIKILGSEYLGLNGLFTNILTILSLAELGIGEAINFSLYKPLADKNEKKCLMLMQFYRKVYIIIGIVILILGCSITPFLSFFIKDLPNISNLNIIYILFVVNTSISYFFSYKRNLIIANQNRYIATIYRYIFYFLLNLIQIIFLLINKDYILFLILQIIFTLLENIFVSIKANKLYPYLNKKKKINLDINSKNEIVKNTKAMMMHKVGGIVVSSTDNVLISKLVGLVEVGIYSNYNLIISALTMVYSQINSSIIASVGNLFTENDKTKEYLTFKKVDFLGFWIYSFSAICLICLFNPFITLWIGQEYLFGIEVVLIITINFYIKGMRKSVLTFKDASGLFYKDRWKAIVEAIINLIVSIILGIKYGTFGIFLGTFISSITVCCWVEPYILFKYGFNKKLSEYFKHYFKHLIVTIVLGFITYYLCSLVNIKILIFSFIAKTFICLIIPNILLYLIFRKTDEFNYFYNLVKGIFNKILHRKDGI